MGFHLLIFCTLLSSVMRSTWPNQFYLCFLMNQIIFYNLPLYNEFHNTTSHTSNISEEYSKRNSVSHTSCFPVRVTSPAHSFSGRIFYHKFLVSQCVWEVPPTAFPNRKSVLHTSAFPTHVKSPGRSFLLHSITLSRASKQ
jgi:hypothetical protein